MKQLILLFFLMLSIPAFSASITRQAKENIKKKQKLEETARNLLAEAAKTDTKHKKKIECLFLAAECSKRINEIENEKLYLGKAYDTTKFYNSIRDMFIRIEKADSVSATPNEKGVVSRTNPRTYRSFLLPYRSNLLIGGRWYYRKGMLAQAYEFFDLYIRMAGSEIFAQDNFMAADTLLPSTAYLSVFCAESLNRPDDVIKHAEMAKNAGLQGHLVQEYYARAYEQKADTTHWVGELYEGLRSYHQHPYFFSQLLDYYLSKEQNEKALNLCDSVIQKRDSVPLYWYAKSLVLLRLHRDRDAIDACDSCIALEPNYVNAHYNKGIASLNLAVLYTEEACTDITDPKCLRDLEIIRSLYMLAKIPMEKVRKLAPNDKERWAAPLYRIYLNLNMGKEFEEMDRILEDIQD